MESLVHEIVRTEDGSEVLLTDGFGEAGLVRLCVVGADDSVAVAFLSNDNMVTLARMLLTSVSRPL